MRRNDPNDTQYSNSIKNSKAYQNNFYASSSKPQNSLRRTSKNHSSNIQRMYSESDSNQHQRYISESYSERLQDHSKRISENRYTNNSKGTKQSSHDSLNDSNHLQWRSQIDVSKRDANKFNAPLEPPMVNPDLVEHRFVEEDKDVIQKDNKNTPKKRSKKKKSKIFSKQVLVGGLAGVILGISFLGHPVLVSGSSMLPNFKSDELIYTMNFPKKINRFDIVIVENDNTKRVSENSLWIKRVVGLPGETIEFKNNKLYVNGKKVKQIFKTETATADFGPVTLGNDEYWIMGDNRDNSCDSRYVGTFKREDIKYIYCFEIPWCPSFLKD